MGWVAVTRYGVEWYFPFKPTRNYPYWNCRGIKGNFYGYVLKKWSIKKLIGRELTWKDEPIELK